MVWPMSRYRVLYTDRGDYSEGFSIEQPLYAAIDAEWPALEAAFMRWLDPANFDHVTGYWVAMTLPLAQVSLAYGVDDLPGPGHDDRPVAGAQQRGALGDVQGLADGVGVPCRAGARGEVDAAARHPGRLGLAHVDRVDVHVAGEPLLRPLPRGLPGFDVHRICLLTCRRGYR